MAQLIKQVGVMSAELEDVIGRNWPGLLEFGNGTELVCHILRELQSPLVDLLPDKEADIRAIYLDLEWEINSRFGGLYIRPLFAHEIDR